jgi:thiol-disulfide isomerase/thioredoxin
MQCSVLALAVLAGGPARAEIKPGDIFPPLGSRELEGTAIPATAGRVVLVDFWASWCAPCKASFPAYEKIEADFGSRGLVIVAVGEDNQPEAYGLFVKKFHPAFATVRDKSQSLAREVKVPAMPTCYLVGRDGRVRFMHQGFHGADTDRELRRELEALLAEPSVLP